MTPHYIRPDGLLCRSEACLLSTDHDGEGRLVDLIWSPDLPAPRRWVPSRAAVRPAGGLGAPPSPVDRSEPRSRASRGFPGDAPSVWDNSCAPGGSVCSACGTPVESEPCREHQPAAYAAMDTEDAA